MGSYKKSALIASFISIVFASFLLLGTPTVLATNFPSVSASDYVEWLASNGSFYYNVPTTVMYHYGDSGHWIQLYNNGNNGNQYKWNGSSWNFIGWDSNRVASGNFWDNVKLAGSIASLSMYSDQGITDYSAFYPDLTMSISNGTNISPPAPPATCTSWTYSDWSSCSNGTQTRTILTSSPSGCTGGEPETLTQSCSMVSSCDPNFPDNLPCDAHGEIQDTSYANNQSAAFFNSTQFGVIKDQYTNGWYSISTSIGSGQHGAYFYRYEAGVGNWNSNGAIGGAQIQDTASFHSYGVLAVGSVATTPAPDQNQTIGASFDYPKMTGSPMHADIQYADITTHTEARVKIDFSNIVDGIKPHMQVFVIKKTDSSFNTVDTANPYLQTFTLDQLDQNSMLSYSLPVTGGSTGYFTLAIAYDDGYSSYHNISPVVIHRYDFSINAMLPNNPLFGTGQLPTAPTLVNGQTSTSFCQTGMIQGFACNIASFLYVPNQTLLNATLGAEWISIQQNFSPITTIFTFPNQLSTGSNEAIYTGTINGQLFSYDPFAAWTIPEQIKTIVSYFLYLGAIFWLIRKIPDLLPE